MLTLTPRLLARMHNYDNTNTNTRTVNNNIYNSDVNSTRLVLLLTLYKISSLLATAEPTRSLRKVKSTTTATLLRLPEEPIRLIERADARSRLHLRGVLGLGVRGVCHR